jgi:uncharacterized protein (DUF58 family)
VKNPFSGRTDSAASPRPPHATDPEPARGSLSAEDPERPGWSASARTRRLATAALLALVAAVLTGHVALVLVAAPALGALALMPRRRPMAELAVEVMLSGARCFEGEDVTITAAVRGGPAEELMLRLEPAPQVTLADPAQARRMFLADGRAAGTAARCVAQWVVRADRWGRYSPGAVLVSGWAGRGGFQTSVRVGLDQLEIFPAATRMRSRLVPAELLRRIGEHTGRAVGAGVEFAGLRPYVPGDPLRDVNRAVSIRRGQLHVNQRAAARAADLVVMIDSLGGSGPVADRTLDAAVHGAAALVTAYLRLADRAGIVVLGGALRWLGPASGMRQFYRIAEMMLRARYDSFVAPDVGRIPRTALPPGTLVVVFSPLLDPRAFGALSDLRQRGFPLVVVDTLRDEPPVRPRPASARGRREDLALRLWRLDRAATRAALRDLGVPVLRWDADAELDSVLAPLRLPPAVRR